VTEGRRATDDDYKKLDAKVDTVANDVRSIRDMLISEPESSPMGRALLRRSATNTRAIDTLRADFETFRKEEFNPIDDWWQQTRGVWRAVIGLGIILGIIGTFFGVVAYFGS
jgi:hypothetical protein